MNPILDGPGDSLEKTTAPDYVPGLVSVVIPAYNAAEYLREAIQGALAQTYRPIEIVVVDDGSIDHTRQVCEAFGSSVRYIYQANDGTKGAGARVQAISRSKGEYIALLDQDDRWLPDKIELQLEAMRRFPEAGVVFTGTREIDADGRLTKDYREGSLAVPASAGGAPHFLIDDAFHLILRRCPFFASSGLFRRTVVSDHELSGLAVSDPADVDLWLRITRRHPAAAVDLSLTEYRRHSSNYTKLHTLKVVEGNVGILLGYKKYMHKDCDVCISSLKAGIALHKSQASTICLDTFQEMARDGQILQGLIFVWKALKLSPSQLIRPGRWVAIAKNCFAGILNPSVVEP